MFDWLAERLAMAVLRKMIKLDLSGKRRNSIPSDYPDRKQRVTKKDTEPKVPRCFSCNRALYSYEKIGAYCRVCRREYDRPAKP